MTLKGNIENFFLASVLQLLSNDKKNGILKVTDGENEVKIYIKDGIIVYATSSQEGTRLVSLLRSRRIVSDDQLKKCLLEAKERKDSLGTLLVEKGYIAPDSLKKLVQEQVENIIYNLFLWKNGEFEYNDAKFKLDGVVTTLNTMEVMLEASRRVDEMSVLMKQIPNNRVVFKMSERVQSNKEIKLNANEWRALSLIDGRRSIRQIIEESGYDEFAVFKILYSLLSSGLIEKSEEIEIGRKGSTVDYKSLITVYNDIFHTIFKTLENELGNQAHKIFDDNKEKMMPDQKNIFNNYVYGNPAEANINGIMETLKKYSNYENTYDLLINTFNDLLRDLLLEEIGHLGLKPTQKTIQDIEKITDYISKYQKSSPEKKQLITDIKNITDSVLSNTDDNNKDSDQKSGGKFSLFKKK